jgi:hypothetical protein
MPDAMVNHYLPNQAKLDVDTATAGLFLLPLTLVLADVLRLDIGEQHFPEDRLQVLPTTLVDAARSCGPVRLPQLPVAIDGARDGERSAELLEASRT